MFIQKSKQNFHKKDDVVPVCRVVVVSLNKISSVFHLALRLFGAVSPVSPCFSDYDYNEVNVDGKAEL